MELGAPWHILAVGLPLDFAPSPLEETGPELAQRALDAGAFVVAAHPQWHTMTDRDVMALGPIHAIEIFNASCADDNDSADSAYMLDMLLARGTAPLRLRHRRCPLRAQYPRPDRRLGHGQKRDE